MKIGYNGLQNERSIWDKYIYIEREITSNSSIRGYEGVENHMGDFRRIYGM